MTDKISHVCTPSHREPRYSYLCGYCGRPRPVNEDVCFDGCVPWTDVKLICKEGS